MIARLGVLRRKVPSVSFLTPVRAVIIAQIAFLVAMAFGPRFLPFLFSSPWENVVEPVVLVALFTFPVWGIVAAWRMDVSDFGWVRIVLAEVALWGTLWLVMLPSFQ